MFSDCLGWALNMGRHDNIYVLRPFWLLWHLAGPASCHSCPAPPFWPFSFSPAVSSSWATPGRGAQTMCRGPYWWEAAGCRNEIWKSLCGFLAFFATHTLTSMCVLGGGGQVRCQCGSTDSWRATSALSVPPSCWLLLFSVCICSLWEQGL